MFHLLPQLEELSSRKQVAAMLARLRGKRDH